jgi:hypothetical protein
LSPTKQVQAQRREEREARWRRAHDLRQQGGSLRGIARDLGINKTTVRRLLATPAPPRNRVIQPRPGGIRSPMLAPFTDYLQQRWRAGCTNGCQLYRELVERGYTGSRTLVLEAIRSWRPAKPPKSLRHRANQRRSDPRRLRRLLGRPPERLQFWPCHPLASGELPSCDDDSLMQDSIAIRRNERLQSTPLQEGRRATLPNYGSRTRIYRAPCRNGDPLVVEEQSFHSDQSGDAAGQIVGLVGEICSDAIVCSLRLRRRVAMR